MRAPPLASMAAVAAPRPDAEPVTIAHKPSPDIRISSSFLADLSTAIYHTVQTNPCKSAKLRLPELIIPARGTAFRRRRGARGDPRLSWHWLFLIMRRKKTPHPRLAQNLRRRDACEAKNRGTLWRKVRTLSRRPRRRSFPISRTPRPSTATRRAPGKRRCG